ncbi:TIGR02530 family flagellar biosynthesis protein [Carboxydochorda subterranea]|uniref:TIGR02530 family flagellar biosynthesis protein n=1 Tax=Carboxydichorda subterranea TaxID=3109565 RepID=A0ABZ1C250_9FIRM|nr:TIGR02530 family flagellar biosynthesis protein [Limnochorda sp. L945t]WRP18920.1 TIGR02530 family flagellar biosynthesis protein [Limnochorda sp. L945t]
MVGPQGIGANGNARPVQPAGRPRPAPPALPTGARGGSFQQILGEAIARREGLRFSAHAQRRLAERRIALTPERRERLEEGVARAEAKGAREAVVMIDRLAFVVSVKNRTVITVVDEPQLKENVFTNIDSVVFG